MQMHFQQAFGFDSDGIMGFVDRFISDEILSRVRTEYYHDSGYNIPGLFITGEIVNVDALLVNLWL